MVACLHADLLCRKEVDQPLCQRERADRIALTGGDQDSSLFQLLVIREDPGNERMQQGSSIEKLGLSEQN
jgi:hypothetical protein